MARAQAQADLDVQTDQSQPTAPDTPAMRLGWLVVYPEVSVLPLGEDGTYGQEFLVVKKGEVLPAECEYEGSRLRALGMVVGVSVPA